MQIRKAYSLSAMLLVAVACAHQIDPGEVDADDDGDTGKGGSLNLGGNPTTGGSSSSKAGSTGTGGSSSGGSTALPPSGTVGGKSGKGGSGGSSTGGTGNEGGSTGTGGSGGGGTVHMPVEGLAMSFTPSSTDQEVDWFGGELLFTNESAQPFALADLKIRYYFTNELADAETSINWSQFGSINNMGNTTCTSTIVKMSESKAGADSYVEITCGAGEMKEMTALKTSWKAGKNGGGIFRMIQADDYSYASVDKIVVLDGNTVIWGSEP